MNISNVLPYLSSVPWRVHFLRTNFLRGHKLTSSVHHPKDCIGSSPILYLSIVDCFVRYCWGGAKLLSKSFVKNIKLLYVTAYCIVSSSFDRRGHQQSPSASPRKKYFSLLRERAPLAQVVRRRGREKMPKTWNRRVLSWRTAYRRKQEIPYISSCNWTNGRLNLTSQLRSAHCVCIHVIIIS